MTNDLFDNPASAAALDLTELNGRLLLIQPSRVETGVKTTLGEKDVTVADVHVLDGPNSGEVHEEAFVWPRVLQAQLRPKVGAGRYVLGRLGQGVAKPGQNPPWKLAEATEDDKEVARKYLAGLSITTPGAAPDDEKPPWEK
ncbi:MAG TPA: hypothetical protein VME67_19500 [Mycobacterium sp.]|nr:hypothetical protein [Mycobacterium sp.]HTX96843.1 hypothetical protein [Mycobacterium sp.]